MKPSIPCLLAGIPLSPEQLYGRILLHRMSRAGMLECGFPLPDSEAPGKVTIVSNNVFPKPLNPGVQKCRCGKKLSLLEDNWFAAEQGCVYHPGKRVYCDGPDNGRFNCCRKTASGEGCARSQHHVSFHKPFEDIEFVQVSPAFRGARHPRNVFALDCEMAFTTRGMELVKVSLVGLDGAVVYDTHVLPPHPVLDHNTLFSGVDAASLRGCTTTLRDVQNQLVLLLNRDSILIGHSVENDFLALHLVHDNVVDTSCVFPHARGHPLKYSLKHLAQVHLGKNIQVGFRGHNSIEDARTCVELILCKIYKETRAAPIPRWVYHENAKNDINNIMAKNAPPPPPFYPPLGTPKNPFPASFFRGGPAFFAASTALCVPSAGAVFGGGLVRYS